jgi:hypothetical protein
MMSEPVEYSAAKGSTGEKDQSYLAIANDLQPTELDWDEIDVTIVKRDPRRIRRDQGRREPPFSSFARFC